MEKDFYDFLHQNNIKTVSKPQRPEPQKRPMTAEEYILPPPKPRPQRPQPVDNQPPLRSQRPVPRPPIQPAAKPVMPKPLNEAYSMIEQMKKKMEAIFYRYGMIGLERLDEALEDVIEEIMNPQPVYIEREPEPMPVVEPPKPKRRKPRRRPQVKKSLPVEDNVVENVEETQEEFVDPLLNDDTPTNAEFANMAANLDLDALNAVMAKEKKMPKRMTEGELQRNAKMKQLESVMEASQEAEEEVADVPEEDYSDEGIEVVDNESEVLNDYEETEEN